jgi:hypothetical protein
LMKTSTSHGQLMDQPIQIGARLSQLLVVMKMILAIIQPKPRFLKMETLMCLSMTFKLKRWLAEAASVKCSLCKRRATILFMLWNHLEKMSF